MAQGREREERATEAEAFRACAQLWAERPVGRAVREERERGTVLGFGLVLFEDFLFILFTDNKIKRNNK